VTTGPVTLHRLERVASTMDVLHAMALDGAPGGTAVVAREQTGGRGSRGRPWASAPGGLWLSVLRRPETASGLDLLSLRAGLAVSRVLLHLAPLAPIRLKWPNDLMLGDRKVGGILCEARWQGDALGWVVVGLGLNISNEVPDELREVAGALGSILPGHSADDLAEPLAEAIRKIDARSARLGLEELAQFGELDWTFGRMVQHPTVGIADGIDPEGALLVRLPEGPRTAIRVGPVELADSSLRA
jgi:BirA family transcriptional regulator, biotin operon repressor / biotin---[acetyl-CoA-carboxylase] ligase